MRWVLKLIRNRISFVALLLLISSACCAYGASPVLVISVDGMRPEYVTQADAHNLKIPVLRSFLREGTYADGVIGVVPTVTFPSHTTLMTGVWPAEHGIYNNLTFDPLGKNLSGWYWYAPDIKVPTLWQAASKAGIVTASMYWPVTVNARGIDYVVPEYYRARTSDDRKLMEALSRPDGYLSKLEEQVGPFNIGNAETSFDELLTKTSIALIKDKKPGFMTIHLISLDHTEHATGPFSAESNAALEAIDGMIGRLVEVERASHPNATIFVVSDHGFARTDYRVNLLIPFAKAGLIELKQAGTNAEPEVASWKATVWNSSGTAAIVLHDPNDAKTLHEVEALLTRLKDDPQYGIARVLTHDEVVVRGGYPNASFLIEWKLGYCGGDALRGEVVDSIPATGTHGYLPDQPELHASFLVIGPEVARHCDAGIIDMRQVAPTVASYLGVSLPTAKQPPVVCKP